MAGFGTWAKLNATRSSSQLVHFDISSANASPLACWIAWLFSQMEMTLALPSVVAIV